MDAAAVSGMEEWMDPLLHASPQPQTETHTNRAQLARVANNRAAAAANMQHGRKSGGGYRAPQYMHNLPTSVSRSGLAIPGDLFRSLGAF
ncbi:hypothetical protein GN958_ATG17357 [Phytophthora infestans]|uniref:Uncharacterized protein n=1 Tax=Phytophthora infestans TaxID=4787 RepID=A0A8S9U5C5_PHYIN|nr:hypothetical protein GN958_ATG17357 [Phytophthora infestans]